MAWNQENLFIHLRIGRFSKLSVPAEYSFAGLPPVCEDSAFLPRSIMKPGELRTFFWKFPGSSSVSQIISYTFRNSLIVNSDPKLWRYESPI